MKPLTKRTRRQIALIGLLTLVLLLLLPAPQEGETFTDGDAGQTEAPERLADVDTVTEAEANPQVEPDSRILPEDMKDPRPATVFSENPDDPAPVIPRGRYGRRVLDTPTRTRLEPGEGEPVRVFASVRPARKTSPFAWDAYTLDAIEAPISHRLFHELAGGITSRLVLPLSVEEEVDVDVYEIVHRGRHTFTFMGKIPGDHDNDVILVYNEGAVSGSMTRFDPESGGARNFQFQVMEDGHVAIKELNEASFLHGDCGGVIFGAEIFAGAEEAGGEVLDGEEDGHSAGEGTAQHLVDIVVGYSIKSRQSDGGTAGIESRIIASVDRMNLAFANSLVDNAEVVLLGMIEDPDYAEPGTGSSLNDEVNALNSPTHETFSVVKDLRNALGADKQAFIVNDADGGDAGRAFYPGVSSVTARTYMTSTTITFAHEVGHNWGLAHSWGDSTWSPDTSKNAHNFGWRFRSGSTRRRTIQSYDWNWQRVPWFGNPEVTHPTLNVKVGAVNGYDASGDGTTDSRYVDGGLEGGLGAGFDGSNSNLGARAAHTLIARAEERSNLRTRASLAVTHPVSGQEVEIDETFSLEWVGGTWQSPVDIELLKGGVPVEVIAEGIPNENRVFAWTPNGLARGSDYQIRLTLNGGEEISLSDPFTIDPLYPRVVDTFVDPTGVADPGLDAVSVTFNRSMDPESFSLVQDVSRFLGPGGTDLSGSLSGVSWSESDTVLTFHFSPLNEEGYYRLDLGPGILDLRGFAMDQNDNAVPGEGEDGFGFSFRVAEGQAGGVQTILQTNFDSGHSFSLEGGWAVGQPNQGPNGPNTAVSSPNVLGTYLNGNYVSGLNISAVSPSFSTLNAENVTVSFHRWLGLAAVTSGQPQGRYQDRAFLEYSVNQGTWQNLWSHTEGSHAQSNWQGPLSYVLPSAANNQSDVRIRFRLQTESGNSYGWNIDDFLMTGDFEVLLSPAPAPYVAGHFPEGAVIVSPTSLWIDFDQPMDTGSFSLGDIVSFSGPDGDVGATGFAWVADNRLRIDFPSVSEDGLYTLTLGTGVLNQEGTPLAATYDATFDLGTFDPPVILTESLPAADVGESYTAGVEAMSDAGLSLTLTVTGRPAWLSFADHGDGTGTLSGTPPHGGDGTLNLTFNAYDGASTSSRELSLLVRPRAVVALSDETTTVMENAGTLTVTVNRTLNDTGAVSVNYVTQDGNLDIGLNAVAGVDYAETSGTLHWADGETGPKTFDVTIYDDDLSQGDRPFSVHIGGVSGIANLGLNMMGVTIVDDDVDVPPRIVLEDQGTVTHMRATLNAFLLAGSEDTTGTLWYGTVDGGEAPGSWQHQVDLGGIGYGPVSTLLEGLTAETTYFYRFQATNIHGQDQTVTDSFTTRQEPDGQTFEITFPGYDRAETLSDFPLLVRISEANIPDFFYANMVFPETGGDLRFYDEAENELSFSVQLWNPEGESLVWVRVPALHAAAAITMVIGDADTETLPAYTTDGSAWNENFRAVYHFHASGTTVPDATSHGFDGTLENASATTFVPGIVGLAYDFSGSNAEHIRTNATATALNIDGSKPRTTSVWAYTRAFNNGAPFQVGANSNGQMWSLRTLNSDNQWRMQFWSGDNDITISAQDEWVYLTMVYDGGNARVYRNGIEVEGSAYSRSLSTSATAVPLQIGNYNNNNYFNGILDELRVSDVPRSENWIWAEWKNMAQTDQFLAFESLGGGEPSAPVITSQPQSVTVVEGQTATFSVTATGNPAPAYQWRKNGVDIPGAADSMYTINNVSQNDAGIYTVYVSNGVGEGIESDIAELNLSDPPPPAPTGLTATAVAFDRIDLSWTDQTDPSDPTEEFRIERSADGTHWTPLTTVTATSHSDTELTGGSTWHYRVLSLRGGLESSPSNVASATTPDAPAAPVIHVIRPLDGVAAIPSGVGLWILASVELDPAVSAVDLQWSQIEGQIGVTFTRPDEAVTGAFFPEDGHYVLRLTAEDGLSTSTRDIMVEVGAIPGAPQIVQVVAWGTDHNMLRRATSETDATPMSDVIPVSFSQNSVDLGLGEPGANDARVATVFSPFLSGMIDLEGADLSTRRFYWVGEQLQMDQDANTGNRRIGPTNSYGTGSDWRGNGLEQYQLYAWHREDFLIEGDFSLKDPEALMSVHIHAFTNNQSGAGLRFVIQNNGIWYYSEAAVTTNGAFTLTNPGSAHWAAFNPEALSSNLASARSLAMPATTTFGPVVFDDIQYVGFATETIRTTNNESRQGFDNFVVTAMTGGAANLGPFVDAGTLSGSVVGEPASLNGAASDDGAPAVPGELVTEWALENGPGAAQFTEASALQTNVIFDTAGLHTLRLVADDGAVATFDLLSVNVEAAVLETPAITTQPQSQTVYATQGAVLSVEATGEDLSFQWHDADGPIEGAVGDSLVFDPVTEADADTYHVVVSNAGGSVDSAFAELTVLPEDHDTHGNGVPDLWEIEYFGSVEEDRQLIRAGFPVSLYTVYVWGFDPLDENAVFELGAMENLVEGVRLSVPTVSGRRYQLQFSVDLTQPDGWTDLGEPQDGQGEAISFEDPTPGTMRAYRIRVWIP
ncbi:MAG: DUF2341 domain-containing protein [Verrucomicrobia bacterium]|nr:DUF2341 domain-containing protein [Verrucomicrobiota bacterium]MCH8513366.1 DUF2341 domain-containing protein [Kiritimatiellia bacterium]